MSTEKQVNIPETTNIIQIVPPPQPTNRRELIHQFLGEIQDLVFQVDALLYLEERSQGCKTI